MAISSSFLPKSVGIGNSLSRIKVEVKNGLQEPLCLEATVDVNDLPRIKEQLHKGDIGKWGFKNINCSDSNSGVLMTTEPPITRGARRSSVDDVSCRAANLAFFETLDRFPNITNLKELMALAKMENGFKPNSGVPQMRTFTVTQNGKTTESKVIVDRPALEGCGFNNLIFNKDAPVLDTTDDFFNYGSPPLFINSTFTNCTLNIGADYIGGTYNNVLFLDGRVSPDVANSIVDDIHLDNRPSDVESVCQNQDEKDQRARLKQNLAPLFFHHIATFINCTIKHLEFMAGVHFVGKNDVLNSPTCRYIMSPFYGGVSGDVPKIPNHTRLILDSVFPDNYPKFIRTDVFNALKGNDPIVYTVEFKDVFSESTMKDTRTLFIQIFNLIFEKYGISAENKDEHAVGEPYGRITLSMNVPSGATGSVDQIDLFSPIICINFNSVQITASTIVHEILHVLGLIHSDVGVDKYMSASSY